MRISTNTIFKAGTTRMAELESSLLKTQQQLALSKRVIKPSDDPVAAAQILELTQSQAVNSQYSVNRQNAKSSLGMEENALQGITTLLQNVKTLTVNAGNGVLDSTQLDYIATELSGYYDELISLSNSRDASGNYIFSGFQTSTQPFTKTPGGATYVGDQGARMLQIGPSRQIALSDNGSAVFESNKTGNGTFVTGKGATNAGTGVISPGSIVNPTALTGHDYNITFTGAATFDVVDATTVPPTTVLSAQPYVSGQSITFDGLQFDVTGTPAVGDSFTVRPSKNQSIFTAMNDLITLLKTPIAGDAGKANLTNGLNAAHASIDTALDSVLTVRASVGSRLKELDSLDTQGDDRDLLYAQSLSTLQDLDYTKAITDLSKQKIMLEAAQQAFVKTSGLTLFNFISG
jgi:flagellar hook-associated protein 3 FlgL